MAHYEDVGSDDSDTTLEDNLSQLLKTDFLTALRADFAVHGADAIAACRDDDPLQYVKLVASLLPKDAPARKDDEPLGRDALDRLSDDELLARIRMLEAAIDTATNRASPAVAASDAAEGGTQTPHRRASSAVLPPLS
ncbi:MAG: hypothetical protein K2P94_18155 [Rhodospirillaceae bacterium]|nr:hypothetical protein [Rhodospirillaceae bacterium]